VTARHAESAGIPILILYSSEDCGYCARLKRELLQPLSAEEKGPNRVLVQEVDIHRDGKMIDFDGEPIPTRRFKQRYRVFAVPTLLILDSRGEPLSEPFVGYASKERYRSRLERLLEGIHGQPASSKRDRGTQPGRHES